MTIKAVIFDLDGTITRFNLNYKSVRFEVCNALASSGIPASMLPVEENIFEIIRRARAYMRKNGRQEKDIGMVIGKALAITEKHEMKAAETTSLLPGVRQTLQTLKGTGLKIGLFTVNSQASTEYILDRFEIRSLFDVVVPRDKVINVKPDSEHLQSVLSVLQIKASEAVVVGDGVSDMKCAKKVGAMAVGLLTGVSTFDNLANAGANCVITQMIELIKLVTQPNAKSD